MKKAAPEAMHFRFSKVSSCFYASFKKNIKSKVSFIDMMFDSDDPDYLDKNFINNVNVNSNSTIILYSGVKIPSLSEDIICIGYQPSIEDNLRKKIARNGKNKYLKYFNSTLVARYILEKTYDLKKRSKYLWAK